MKCAHQLFTHWVTKWGCGTPVSEEFHLVGVEFPLVVMFKNRWGKSVPWDHLCIVDSAVELGSVFNGGLQSFPFLFYWFCENLPCPFSLLPWHCVFPRAIKTFWSSKTHPGGLHTFCCLAVPLLEMAKDHVRVCTLISSPHRRWEFLILDEAFKLQWWVLFSSGVICPHPSMSADMGLPPASGQKTPT